jgi:phosphatidylglycerol:prolipoprotein diacylglycerol transferase
MGVAFHIGPIAIHWYGIMLVIAIIAAMFLARAEAKRRGENPDHIFTSMLLVVPLGFIGARAYHVIDQWNEIYSHDLPAIFGGAGLGIFGTVIGGAIGVFIYTKWKKLNMLRWFDIAAPALILAQAIGRWGNYFNQELYGKPTDLPWGIKINNPVAPYTSDQRFHPLFAYESILNLLGCILLLIIGRKYKNRLLDGDIFFLYLIYYSTIRFSLEWLRIDPWTIAGMPTACWVSLIAIAISISIMIYRRRRRRRLDIDQPSEGGGESPEPPSNDVKEAV